VGQPERKSLGEDSVNDYTVKEDDTMDDILRFLLKVMVGCNQCICVCCMYLCMTMSCAGLSAALLMFMLRCVRTIRVIESCKLSLPFHQSMAGPLVPVMCCSAKRWSSKMWRAVVYSGWLKELFLHCRMGIKVESKPCLVMQPSMSWQHCSLFLTLVWCCCKAPCILSAVSPVILDPKQGISRVAFVCLSNMAP